MSSFLLNVIPQGHMRDTDRSEILVSPTLVYYSLFSVFINFVVYIIIPHIGDTE